MTLRPVKSIIILFLWKFYCTQILFPIDLHDFRYNSFISNNPTEGIILFLWIIFILTTEVERDIKTLLNALLATL